MKKLIVYILLMIALSSIVFAHSGGTDSKGGHYNRSTGEYHYHHGKPAHDHPEGVCPYEETPKTQIQRSSAASDKAETAEIDSFSNSFSASSALLGASVPISGYVAVKVYLNTKRRK